MSWFAVTCFCSVAVAQMVAVLVLTPALVAGVIADEKQRKTLHYLLASRLSGPEIVIGKLLARMLHIAVLLGVGFPVLSLLVLLGGIDPVMIMLACGAAASTAWFLAALAIWVSTIARRAREALFITYGLEFLWLFLPIMVTWSPSFGWPPLDLVVWTLGEWLSVSTPIPTGMDTLYGLQTGVATPVPSLIAMIQCQVIAGALLAFLAAWQLRPVFRSQEAAEGRRRGPLAFLTRRRSLRLWSRPKLGDHPMLWKELFTARARGFARLVAVLVTLFGGGFLLYYALWFGGLAFLELRDSGFDVTRSGWVGNSERYKFLYFLRFVIPLLYVVGILSVAGAAAASITAEHEDDTWTSLTSTDLTGREIILAKQLGALWRPRGVVAAIWLLVVAGCLVGSLHSVSLTLISIALLIYGWFAVALGTWISLQLRSTWRAQFLTTASLLLINLTGQAILSNSKRFAPLLWPGFTPYEISKLLLAWNDRWERHWFFPSSIAGIPAVEDGPFWTVVFSIASLTCYLAGAIALTLLSLRQFEVVAGRAQRSARRLHPDLVDTRSRA